MPHFVKKYVEETQQDAEEFRRAVLRLFRIPSLLAKTLFWPIEAFWEVRPSRYDMTDIREQIQITAAIGVLLGLFLGAAVYEQTWGLALLWAALYAIGYVVYMLAPSIFGD